MAMAVAKLNNIESFRVRMLTDVLSRFYNSFASLDGSNIASFFHFNLCSTDILVVSFLS